MYFLVLPQKVIQNKFVLFVILLFHFVDDFNFDPATVGVFYWMQNIGNASSVGNTSGRTSLQREEGE